MGGSILLGPYPIVNGEYCMRVLNTLWKTVDIKAPLY